jgi:hypothetical protein
MEELAAAWVSPTTFGTLTEAEPPEPPESPPPPQAVRISAAMIAAEPLVIPVMAFVVMCSPHPVISLLLKLPWPAAKIPQLAGYYIRAPM